MKWLLTLAVLIFTTTLATAEHLELLHEGNAIRVFQWCETVADAEGFALAGNEDGFFSCWQPASLMGGILGEPKSRLQDKSGFSVVIHEVTNVIINVGDDVTPVFQSVPTPVYVILTDGGGDA